MIVSFSLGMGPIPWLIMSEVLTFSFIMHAKFLLAVEFSSYLLLTISEQLELVQLSDTVRPLIGSVID